MRYLFETPQGPRAAASEFWVGLHGCLGGPEQIVDLLSAEARSRGALLLAPEASQDFGAACRWSFRKDAHDISVLVQDLQRAFDVPSERLCLLGYASGCTTALCLLEQHPGLFGTFVALAIGSAFEPLEGEQVVIDDFELARSAGRTRTMFVCDPTEPMGSAPVYERIANRLRHAGIAVDLVRPCHSRRDVADEMKAQALDFML